MNKKYALGEVIALPSPDENEKKNIAIDVGFVYVNKFCFRLIKNNIKLLP